MAKPTISLVLYVLDEAEHIERAILSAINFVDEILVWDTGSMDGTADIAATYADRLYRLRVPEEAVHFGEMETMAAHLAKCDWVLRLDGDEELEGGEMLRGLASQQYGAWAFPRYRWADLGKTVQLEREAFPDFQYRFVLNDGKTRWVDPLHPRFETPHQVGTALLSPCLNHFVDPLHLNNPERVAQRNRLYARLAAKAGKAPEGSPEAMRLAQVVIQEPTPDEVEQTVRHVANHPPFVGG